MKKIFIALLLSIFVITGCGTTEVDDVSSEKETIELKLKEVQSKDVASKTEESASEEEDETSVEEVEEVEKAQEKKEESTEKETEKATQPNKELFAGYTLIEVDGGDLSGTRKANVVVDIGFGDREYFAFTNEYGQLVRVVAAQIIVQDDNNEPVKSNGRYYWDEAKVPGVESDTLDEGHVIADSLGGVSNAYNITPQDSTLNRHGDQAYMEDAIRKAGGATNFEAIITYPDTKTQIPSSYKYTYTLRGNVIVDTFDNVNPDEVNKSLGLTESKSSNSTSKDTSSNKSSSSKSSSNTSSNSNKSSDTSSNKSSNTSGDLSSVDTNGNGKVTISEAKAAGFKMPITSDHWLYQYMDDRDGDGMVGE